MSFHDLKQKTFPGNEKAFAVFLKYCPLKIKKNEQYHCPLLITKNSIDFDYPVDTECFFTRCSIYISNILAKGNWKDPKEKGE